MIEVNREKSKIEQVAVAYNRTKGTIYQALDSTFARDLPSWNAVIDSVSLVIRFREPDVLFEPGSAEVKEPFKVILRSFFPRYVQVIRERGGADLEEVRIEGHTSSEANHSNPYFYNMELSQARTRAVLQFCLDSTGLTPSDREWVRGLLTANGLSSSRRVLLPDGQEDRPASRRVEFRVRTNAEVRLAEILRPSE
ncbi:MAG: OmpA family protein [Gemmatimonadetes bacterium]|nr:OmpA family protein [Gemmatimonadota bacterium]